MEDAERNIDDLVTLFDRARANPDLSALAQNAASEFLAAEAALARANAAEALAFRVMERTQSQE